jgi:hypothetical protein
MKARLLVAICLVMTAVILPVAAQKLAAEAAEETAQVTGIVKMIEVNLDGKNSGTVYFSIKPSESGAPSDFHVAAADVAAVQVLCSSRLIKAKVILTYKPDFTVTQVRL